MATTIKMNDSVIGFQYEGEAQRFLQALRERRAPFGLQLHSEKTRLIHFRRYAARNCRERVSASQRPSTFWDSHIAVAGGAMMGASSHLTIKKRMRTTLMAIRKTLREDAMNRSQY